MDESTQKEEVQDHEKSCRFQCISCPLSYKQLFPEKSCSWTGNIKLLSDHLKTHSDHFLDNPQFEWPWNKNVVLFFTHVENQIVTVVLKYHGTAPPPPTAINYQTLVIVMANGTDLESQCFRYQLELSDEHKNKSVILRMNRLEPLSEFPDNLERPEKVLDVETEYICQMLQYPQKLLARFSIVKKNKEIVQITGVKDGEMPSGTTVTLAELKCPVCNEYMIPPIYICTTGHSLCSVCKTRVATCPTCRCNFADGRNFTLEKLTLKVKYPCRNREIGCGFVTTSDKIKLHQSRCELSENPCILKFQCTTCPLFYKLLFPKKSCSWTGNTKLLSDHLKTHSDDFLDNPQFEWPEEKNVVFFTHVANQIVTVVIKHDDYCYYSTLVMANDTELESQCFRYQLKFSDEDKNNSLIMRMNRLQPLSEFPDNLEREEKVLQVDIDWISEKLQNPKKILARFDIVKKNKKEIVQITGVKDGEMPSGTTVTLGKEKNALSDEEMLAELECPVCNEYMIPPIYICTTGHSLCSVCKSRVATCPTCRCNFVDGRNFTLEKLTLKVKYPCRNREIGCGFVTTSDKIKLHQSRCEWSENPCILKCGWKGLFPGMYNHFLDRHASALLEHNTPILMDVKLDKNISHYFLYVMGELFCLSFRNCGKFTVQFSIQHVGHLDSEPSYKYSIQFSASPNVPCPNFTLTNFCQTWNDNLAEALNNHYVTLHGDLIKNYSFQNHLYYIKININKV